MNEKKKPIKLDDIPKKVLYEAPLGYFDTLQGKIDRRIEEKVVVRHIYHWKYVSAVAASLALMVVLWFALLKQSFGEQDQLADVSATDMITYLENTELELDDIISTVNAERLYDEDAFNVLPSEIDQQDAALLLEILEAAEPDSTQDI